MSVSRERAAELLTHNLRRLTAASHTPLTVIADRAGIDRRELFAVLAGEQDVDLDWLYQLADGLGVPASELLREPDE
ncbi:helix-turn-helix domain-containing protein [Plesiocystis pacifica]|uniref:helix-turn-helix domain-containing protein n=1 Tax=Plesiocystis pacifica TaxID=191768 RepID=UPI000A30DAA3|nr:transcriptional regulator [Plesiocystis pacifica]